MAKDCSLQLPLTPFPSPGVSWAESLLIDRFAMGMCQQNIQSKGVVSKIFVFNEFGVNDPNAGLSFEPIS
jgi:hypothetical protein